MTSPIANHGDRRERSGKEDRERSDPCDSVEAASGGGGQHRSSEFLYKRLQHAVVTVVALNRRHELLAHAVRVRTTDMVAFEQYLVAAADAHHAMTKIVEARPISTGPEQQHC